MKERQLVKIGRRISYLLRHNNEDLKMDTDGWVNVVDILDKLNIPKFALDEIVTTNDKQRFDYNDDETKIRANQGHSLDFVKIKFEQTVPPVKLFHGTKNENISDIMSSGLKKMSRQYIHLSKDDQTAYKVGKRHSRQNDPVILLIDSEKMYDDGYKFYISKNGVWLTDHVPSKYISMYEV